MLWWRNFLFDFLGDLKQQLTTEAAITILNVEDYASGIYFLKVKKDGDQWAKKIFIE